eukprot:TRINITY_DN9402_c0_g1_i1.p1 TRINITY_DN9402_c0_g1~~TRINITY_DN9402_c0_g1_i1.p1  ORF type:complete len:114 (-),score=9.55 TRINITY_DN9402_c0_g1_i1:48-389(-)
MEITESICKCSAVRALHPSRNSSSIVVILVAFVISNSVSFSHPQRKQGPIAVTESRDSFSVESDWHLTRNAPSTSVTLLRDDKSTDVSDVHLQRKAFPILLTESSDKAIDLSD